MWPGPLKSCGLRISINKITELIVLKFLSNSVKHCIYALDEPWPNCISWNKMVPQASPHQIILRNSEFYRFITPLHSFLKPVQLVLRVGACFYYNYYDGSKDGARWVPQHFKI